MKFATRFRDGAMALAATALLGYVVLRAARVPIVHDEAFSTRNFIGRSFATILSHDAPGSVNNHVLNSLLARSSVLAFGLSEWSLRLPNVLAYGLYLFCGAALCRRLSGAAAVCGFLLFAANPFVLELFSLSRGYGLALAMLSASLLFFLRSEERPDAARRTLALGGLCGFLSVLANLVFLLPVLALVAVSAVRNRPRLRSRAPALALAPLLVLILLGPRIASLKNAGQFYAGGSRGFFADSVGSLVQATCEYPGERPFPFAAGCAAAAAMALLGLVGALAPGRTGGARLARIAGGTLVLSAAGSVLQHAVAGTPYLADRTAVFFVPLLALSAAGGLDALAAGPRRTPRLASHALAAVLALAALLPLGRFGNFDRTALWLYDADSRRITDDLVELHARGLARIRLGGDWVFEPALNFYREMRHLEWLEPIVRYDPLDACNVALLSPDALLGIAREEFEVLRVYPLSLNTLLARVRPAGSGTAREDPGLTGSLDTPAEDETLAGDLRVGGWARIPGQDLRVTITLDGVPRDPGPARTPRADVAAALPALGDCSKAGYETVIPRPPGATGRHTIGIVFTSADGHERHYAVRRFSWRR